MNPNSLTLEQDTSDPVDYRLLEQCLKESSQKRNIYKIEERQSRKLISDGDFYLSSTWQETVQAKNNQGDIWQKCLIVKTLPQGEQARSFVETQGWFKKEIKMYTEVLPKFDALLNNTENAGEPLWPKYIGMLPYNTLILEDLTAKGYRKADRLLGLDLEHSLLAFKGIAKFHALSLALKDELRLQSKEFARFGAKDENRKDNFMNKLIFLSITMRNEWEPKWHRLADHLANNAQEIVLRFLETCERKDHNFNVLNHGDPWTSNMLFKYSEFTGKVIGIRFIDFQLRHYGSFALDLQYLLNTSVQVDVLKHHSDKLLAVYYESLTITARRMAKNNKNITIPSLADIAKEMKASWFFGLMMSIFLLDMILVEPAEAQNLDTILQNKWINRKPLSQPYQDRMRVILEPYLNNGDLTCL